MYEIEEFKELGLSKNEGKIYSTLIEYGKMGAGEISAKSGVSYSRIYDLLEALAHRGLVEVIPEKTKKFIPSNPEFFIKLVEEKEKTLTRAREKIKQLKQFYDVKEKNPVSMGFGRKSFYKIVQELKEPREYDYSVKWSVQYKSDWVESSKKHIRKKVDIKVLARSSAETEKNLKDWLKVHNNFRKFDNNGVAMAIIDDEEVMISLIKSNTTLHIRDKPFAKIMKRMFLDSYNAAEEIK